MNSRTQRNACKKLGAFNEKGLEMFFSILEAIEVQFSSIFEMGNGHILNSATVLSSITGMGDLLHSINN